MNTITPALKIIMEKNNQKFLDQLDKNIEYLEKYMKKSKQNKKLNEKSVDSQYREGIMPGYESPEELNTPLRPLGHITDELEVLFFELYQQHEIQMHEFIGMHIQWAKMHCPECIESFEDGTEPVLKYGHKDEV